MSPPFDFFSKQATPKLASGFLVVSLYNLPQEFGFKQRHAGQIQRIVFLIPFSLTHRTKIMSQSSLAADPNNLPVRSGNELDLPWRKAILDLVSFKGIPKGSFPTLAY